MGPQRKGQDPPLISPSSSSPSTPSSTQVFNPMDAQLHIPGIPQKRVEALTNRYNRRSIPMMEDEEFHQILREIATEIRPDEVEAELRRYLDHLSTDLDKQYRTAKFSHGIAGLDMFETDSQRFYYTRGLREHTIFGFERFVAVCLPPLIKGHEKTKAKRRGRPCIHRSHDQNLAQMSSRPSTRGTNINQPRRSARISRKPERRSIRIQQQNERKGILQRS